MTEKINKLYSLLNKITCGDDRRRHRMNFSVMINQAKNAEEFENCIDVMLLKLGVEYNDLG